MKRNFVILGSCIAFVAIVFLFACNEQELPVAETSEIESIAASELEKDLLLFSNKHAALLSPLFQKGETGIATKAMTVDGEVLYDAVMQNAEAFWEKYEEELMRGIPENGVQWDAESMDLARPDTEKFFSYIAQFYKKEFCGLYEQIWSQGVANISEEEVVANLALRQNEKFILLAVLPVLRLAENQDFEATKASNPCLDQYYADRRDCAWQYAVDCATGAARNPLLAVVEVAVATVALNTCLDTANSTYLNCQKK